VIATAAQAGTQESWPRARLVRPDHAIHLFEREQASAFSAVARLGSPMPVGVAVAARSAAVAMSAWRRLSTPSSRLGPGCVIEEGQTIAADARRPSWKREAIGPGGEPDLGAQRRAVDGALWPFFLLIAGFRGHRSELRNGSIAPINGAPVVK
jgi:hypothetical protein